MSVALAEWHRARETKHRAREVNPPAEGLDWLWEQALANPMPCRGRAGIRRLEWHVEEVQICKLVGLVSDRWVRACRVIIVHHVSECRR